MPAAAPPRAITDAEITSAVDQVLARPRYASFRLETYDVWSRLGEWLRALLDGLAALRDENPSLYALIATGMLLVCLALLAHITWTIRAALRASPPDEKPPAREGRDFSAEAARLAERGAFLEASHLLLLAALRALAAGRHVVLQPEDTNAAVCRRVASCALPHALRDELIALIRHTEREWFRGGEADATLVSRWQAALRELRSQGAPAPGRRLELRA